MRHRAFISLTVAGAVLVTLSGTSIAIDTTRTQVVHSIESELTLGEPEQRLAAHWDMDVREWSRYRELSQGLRGHLSGPGITPVEVLGIHARSPEERRHYARRFARLMYEDTKKVLAFQRDYDQEVRHLTQGGPLIDPEQVRIRDANSAPELVETDTILLFVKSDCPVCDRLLEQALQAHESVAGIEIYIAGMERAELAEFDAWLTAGNIDPSFFRSGKVRFQSAQPLLQSLNRSKEDLPILMKRRNGRLKRLSTSALP